MVHGLVLAAGASTRMGQPKALLTLDGETFVGRIARRLRTSGCGSIAVVMGAHADEIESVLPMDVLGVRHPGWADGMRSSLRAGLSALPEGHVVLTHVDRPLVSTDTLTRLCATLELACVPRIPRHDGIPGHPVFIPATLRPRLMEVDDIPLRTILSAHAPHFVEVDDPGVLMNINTPADYQRLTRSGG